MASKSRLGRKIFSIFLENTKDSFKNSANVPGIVLWNGEWKLVCRDNLHIKHFANRTVLCQDRAGSRGSLCSVIANSRRTVPGAVPEV